VVVPSPSWRLGCTPGERARPPEGQAVEGSRGDGSEAAERRRRHRARPVVVVPSPSWARSFSPHRLPVLSDFLMARLCRRRRRSPSRDAR